MRALPCQRGPNFQWRNMISVVPFEVLSTWKAHGSKFAAAAPGKLESIWCLFVCTVSGIWLTLWAPGKTAVWSTQQSRPQFGTRRTAGHSCWWPRTLLGLCSSPSTSLVCLSLPHINFCPGRGAACLQATHQHIATVSLKKFVQGLNWSSF